MADKQNPFPNDWQSRPVEAAAQNQFYRDAINYLVQRGVSPEEAQRRVGYPNYQTPAMEVPEYEPSFVQYPARAALGMNDTEVEAVPKQGMWKKISNVKGQVR